jgi:hypothetical protein
MNIMVPFAMFGWIPLVVILFACMTPRRAVLMAFLLAWLFLPIAAYKIPMIPAYTKITAATLGTLLGVLIFDSTRLMAFRPKWVDLIILLWCVAKIGSSVSNGVGLYDGLSSAEYLILIWGLPWLFGRLYFSDAAGMRELVVGIALGGLMYVPLCLLEAKMSPQLNYWVYGFHAVDWAETKRLGGWRPTVFMQHGLMVGMWMCMSGLIAWWLWRTKGARKIWMLPAGIAAMAILVTALICRSFGAIGLLAIGMGSLWLASKTKRTFPMWCVLLFIPVYMFVRLSGTWSGNGLIELSTMVGSSDRAGSLQVRLHSEDQFIRAGWHQPWFGFRGWYNTTDLQDKNSRTGIPDALWMIEFTAAGLFGVTALTSYLLLPTALAWRKIKPADWKNPDVLTAIGLGMIVTLSMVDNLFNAMLNPMFMLGAGALSGWSKTITARRPSVPGAKTPSLGARTSPVWTTKKNASL